MTVVKRQSCNHSSFQNQGNNSSLVDGADEKCFLDGCKKVKEEERGPLSSFFILKLTVF